MHPAPWAQAALRAVLAPETLLGSFVVLFVGGVLFYLLTSGTSWLYYCVWRRERFFPGWNPNTQEEHRWRRLEWRWAFWNLLGNALITAPIHHGIIRGKSRIYFDIADHGWGYWLVSISVVLVVTEPLVYWAHRMLHHPVLYKHLHLPHHQFRTPSPWTSMAFHPLDSFAQAAPHHLLAYVLPLHVSVYAFFIMFLQVWSTFIHERVTWVTWPIVNFTAHHTLHHKLNKSNYGQFFTICDRIWGTYKSPDGIVYDGADRQVWNEARGAAVPSAAD
jgi:lathosterol oxidase